MTPLLTPAATPAAPPAPTLAALRAPLRDAASGHPGVLALASAPLALPDLLDAFAANTADAFYWEQPAQDIAILGLGAADAIEPRGDTRFADAARWWRDTAAAAVAAPGFEAQPFAAGGFAFAARASASDDVWAGWPRGAWTAPAVVLERRGARGVVQLQTRSAAVVDAALSLAAQALAAQACHTETPGGSADPRIRFHDDPDHDWWDGSMRVVLDAIASGALRKQVLARRVCALASRPIDVALVLRRLRDRFPAPPSSPFVAGAASSSAPRPRSLWGCAATRSRPPPSAVRHGLVKGATAMPARCFRTPRSSASTPSSSTRCASAWPRSAPASTSPPRPP